MQSGVELPYQAVRYQIADAIDLVLHLGRAAGSRVVRELIRIHRYDSAVDRYATEALFPTKEADNAPTTHEDNCADSNAISPR